MDQVLVDLLGTTCVAYLDEILFFTEGDLDYHWKVVNEILACLNKAGLKLEPQKIVFASKEIKYLGFVVDVKERCENGPEEN